MLLLTSEGKFQKDIYGFLLSLFLKPSRFQQRSFLGLQAFESTAYHILKSVYEHASSLMSGDIEGCLAVGTKTPLIYIYQHTWLHLPSYDISPRGLFSRFQ